MKAENECRHRIKYLLACISGFIPRCQDEITWRETTSSHIRDEISEGHIHQILFLNGFDKKKKKTNNLISVNCVFLFLCSGFYLVLHVIHAAENKISVFIEDEGHHMPSFLAFILVIKKLSCKRARSRFVIFSR